MWSYFILALVSTFKLVMAADANSNDGFMGTTSDLIRLRGFEAIDHNVTTSDGYILNLVELLNPTIPNGYSADKRVMICIHGIRNNAKVRLTI